MSHRNDFLPSAQRFIVAGREASMAKLHCLGRTVLTCAGLVMLAACGREGHDEMSWARAALERNNGVEVVAADQQSHTFTVRLKDSGELRTVRADQIVAYPPGATAAATQPADGKTLPAVAVAPARTASAAAAAPDEAVAADASQQTDSEPAPRPRTQQASLVPQSAALEDGSPGRVLESGPGYSIKAVSAGPQSPARAREASMTGAPIERRHEPIVCQGARLVQIDNRNLVFDGDAVSAEDGCELHITNSHISASGIGVLARAANVHIDNSLIEGDQASIDASGGAQVYAVRSRFKGLSRRLDTASFHDLGGNVWN